MKPFLSLFLLLLFAQFLPCILAAQQTTPTGPAIRIVWTMESEALPAGTAVFLTGNLEALGGWNPGKIKMEGTGDHRWKKEIILPAPSVVEYKFTLGDWQHEAANEQGLPLQNFRANITRDTVIRHVISRWTSGGKPKAPGQVTGTVVVHKDMKGDGIPGRDVIVWLPPGYAENNKQRYPVIYMHDGQNIFDPATSSFGVDWRIDETADSLISAGVVEPVIIVGIYNSPDRMKEYLPGEKGTAYMNFVAGKVKPFIDSAYRTKAGRKHTMTGGSSAGGILSFMLVWEYPNLFSKAICMSPAFVSPEGNSTTWNYAEVVLKSKKRRHVFFYIDNGGVELDAILQPGVDEMLNALKKIGYHEGRDFVFISDPEAKHFESAWAKRFPDAMEILISR